MSLDEATRERLDAMIRAADVVLFMKGDRSQPQCGFSARVVGVLDALVAEYATHDVLADPEVREGIKVYSAWPTVPQLYVKGEFVGGCDIIEELSQSGELAETLGLDPGGEVEAPKITITAGAGEALRAATERAPEGAVLHLSVDARYQNKLFFAPASDADVIAQTSGFAIHFDRMSAPRAEGMTLDAAGQGFRIDNPNAPGASVFPMSVAELKALLDRGERFELLDVRTPEERATASIPTSKLMTELEAQHIGGLAKDTRLVFHCHHGGRSQAAAEHFAALGFTNVHNLTGGVDAWSQEIDASVPRY